MARTHVGPDRKNFATPVSMTEEIVFYELWEIEHVSIYGN